MLPVALVPQDCLRDLTALIGMVIGFRSVVYVYAGQGVGVISGSMGEGSVVTFYFVL